MWRCRLAWPPSVSSYSGPLDCSSEPLGKWIHVLHYPELALQEISLFLFGFALFDFTFVDLSQSSPTAPAAERTLHDIIVWLEKWSEICWFRVLETVISAHIRKTVSGFIWHSTGILCRWMLMLVPVDANVDVAQKSFFIADGVCVSTFQSWSEANVTVMDEWLL